MGNAAGGLLAILTETDVVSEETQKALALFLPVATSIARAPGGYAGGRVVNVVGSDGAACGKDEKCYHKAGVSGGDRTFPSWLALFAAPL